MGLKDLLDLGTETLAVFKDHILILLAVIAVAFIVGSRRQRSVDDGEIRGVNAENKALKEQLTLARDEQAAVTTQLEMLKPFSGQLATELAELKREVTGMKNVLPQLDRVASTSASLTDTVKIVLAANTALGATLTPPGAVYSDTPQVIKLTKESE